MLWYVHRFWRVGKRCCYELLGRVRADHHPGAVQRANKRWPELGRMRWPDYPNGQLAVRRDRLQ